MLYPIPEDTGEQSITRENRDLSPNDYTHYPISFSIPLLMSPASVVIAVSYGRRSYESNR